MKIFFILFVFIFLIPVVTALDIGYIVRNPGNLDSSEKVIIDFLKNEKHNVSVLGESTSRVSDYELIIVSNSVKDISFDNKNKKTLFLNNKLAYKKGFSKSYGQTSVIEVGINKIHFITEKFSLGNLKVYSSQSYIGYLKANFAPNSQNLIIKSSDKSVLLAVDKNTLLLDGKRSNERNLFFGLISAEKWNSNAKELFRSSIQWLVSGGLVDEDEDGYHSIISGGDDCDDTDSKINPGSSDINKNCKNDPPKIENYPLEKDITILENIASEFKIKVIDDTNNTITWRLNNEIVSQENNYFFNKSSGDYILNVLVSDGEFFSEYSWNIKVRDSSFFTCQNISGYKCLKNEICTGKLFDTSDGSCCSTVCIPEFRNIKKKCADKNNKIEIIFENLNENYFTGGLIKGVVKIKNSLEKKSDFKLSGYLYNIDEERIEEKIEDSFDVKKGETESSDFEIFIPHHLKEDNNYALYFYAEEDKYCNDKYIKIDINRKKNNIVIEKIDTKEDYACGDYANIGIEIKNFGTEDKDVYLRLISPELGIDEKTDVFKLEKYKDDDSEKKEFIIKISDIVKAGEYLIKAEAYFDNEKVFLDNKIVLGECERNFIKDTKTETINITENLITTGKSLVSNNNIKEILLVASLLIFFVLVILWFISKSYSERPKSFSK